MINYLIYTIVFVFGLTIGSFINVLIFRLPKGEDIVIKPSHCMTCGQRIKFYDLIPVFSYIFLRGKCRHCGEKISIQYPLIELLTAASLVGIYYIFGWTFSQGSFLIISSPISPDAIIKLIAMMVLMVMFITVFFIDLKHYIIPNEIIIFGIAAGLIFAILKGFNYYNWNYDWSSLKDAGLGFLVGGLTFFLIVIIGEWIMKAEAMGMGDVKLMAVVGLFLGFKITILSMFLAFIIGSIVSIFLLATKIKGRKDQIPFGPFIVMGSVVAMIWGDQILRLYFSVGKF
jgi:leader peptidase (prepilin peptidase)/N-methyltransferase